MGKVLSIIVSSSSSLLSNRDHFFCTIPSDDQQTQAMIDLKVYFGRDHVSTIYLKNMYRLAQKEKTCIDMY